MQEPIPQTPEVQKIKEIAERILAAKGKVSESEHYQPESGLGGGYTVYTTETTFKKDGITISGYQHKYDSEVGEKSLIITDVGNRVIPRFFHSLGIYEGSIVFMQNGGKPSIFESGNWQKKLENLVN